MSPWTPQPTGLTPLCLDASRPCALAHPFPPLPRPAPGVLLLGVLPSPHPNPPGLSVLTAHVCVPGGIPVHTWGGGWRVLVSASCGRGRARLQV